MNPRPSRARSGPRLAIALLGLAVVVAAVWSALSFGNVFPPQTVLMATGPEGGAYREFGVRYREILRRAGVDLQLVGTKGGVENLAQLRDPRSEVSVAFVEAGVTTREESPHVVSLGTVSLEPLWLFLRAQSAGSVAETLKGKRISVEPEGSGTRLLALRLLALNRVDETNVELLALTPEESAEALVRGEIDGAILLASGGSPAVHELLLADGIVLQSYPRADAYVARFPYLSKVILPTGVADLARNIPTTDLQLLAVETSLVVRKGLHPALQYLLLEAASEIHGGPELFHRAGRFPAPDAIDLPLSHQAREFYKSGRPFVYRYLPFWLAALAERLLILLIPLFAVVFPIAQFVPTAIAFVIQRRIFGLYGELRMLEMELEEAGRGAPRADLAADLENLAKRASHLRVPLGYAQRLFILKSHIAQALEEVDRRRGSAEVSTPDRS
jgi:TRAP transporter TAXI family solute receptor